MFRVLFSIVVSLSVLDCKNDDKIDLSLTKKEADFVLDVLSSSIQNGTEEPGQDYKSDDSDESPNSTADMVEGTDALSPSSIYSTHHTFVEYLCPFQVPKNLELLKGSEPLHYFHYFYPPVFL